MASSGSSSPDRPAPRRKWNGRAAIAITAVLVVQVALVYAQSRVLARQENVLHQREAVLDRMSGVADQVTASLEKLMKAMPTASVQPAHYEAPSDGGQPLVVLPIEK